MRFYPSVCFPRCEMPVQLLEFLHKIECADGVSAARVAFNGQSECDVDFIIAWHDDSPLTITVCINSNCNQWL